MIYRREFLDAHRYDVVDRACPVLVVGEDNPHSDDAQNALFPYPVGCAGHRYAELITDVGAATHLATWRTNLCNPRWSMNAARARADLLLRTPGTPWSVIVMLGRKVSDAFARATKRDLAPFEALEFLTDGGPSARAVRTLVYLPHPSGRNLVWNDQAQIHRARALLARVAPSWYGTEAAPDAVSGG